MNGPQSHRASRERKRGEERKRSILIFLLHTLNALSFLMHFSVFKRFTWETKTVGLFSTSSHTYTHAHHTPVNETVHFEIPIDSDNFFCCWKYFNRMMMIFNDNDNDGVWKTLLLLLSQWWLWWILNGIHSAFSIFLSLSVSTQRHLSPFTNSFNVLFTESQKINPKFSE